MADGRLRELVPPQGGDWGGVNVDRKFLAMLKAVLGLETMMKFQQECLADVFDLLKSFEAVKRTIGPETHNAIKIRIPQSLRETNMLVNNENATSSQMRHDFLKTLKSSSFGNKIIVKGDKLKVDAEFAQDMFSHPIHEMIKCVKHIFESPGASKVDTMLIVGGFSECQLVQAAFRKHFPNKKMVFPAEAGLVVLKGAVLYGHNPGLIASRKARFTYGIKHMDDFVDGLHDKCHKVVENGVAKCDNLFQVYVRKNTDVPAGHKVSERHLPSKRDILRNHMSIAMYLSLDDNPTYVTETSCQLLGTLDVTLPKTQNKAYETTCIFGETEVMLLVKHVESKETFSQYFNFQ